SADRHSLGDGGQPDHSAGLTPDDFARIQADTVSLHAKALLPILLNHLGAMTPAEQPALDLLRRWNFDATRDSAAAAVFQAWFLQLTPVLAGDELGAAVTEAYQGKFSFVSRFLASTLASNDSPWCDDTATAAHETCDEA